MEKTTKILHSVKYLLLSSFSVFILTMILISSCSNINDVNPTTSSICGRIENWYYGSDKKIMLSIVAIDQLPIIILDSANILEDGSFTLNFNNPPENIYSGFYHYDGEECLSNVQIYPAGFLMWLRLKMIVDSDSGFIGTLTRATDTVNIYDQYMTTTYGYFNKNGNITGRDSCFDSWYNMLHVHKYNLNYTVNTLLQITDIYHEYIPNQYVEYYHTTDLHNLKWYFFPSEYNDNIENKKFLK